MKSPFASLVLAAHAVLTAAVFAAETPAQSFPPDAIPNSQLRVLPPSASGRHYQLHIGLPASYGTQPNKRYPVVYVTDGYWHLMMVSPIQSGLVHDKYAPEFITVGLGYAGQNLNYGTMRRWELTPAPTTDTSGHAADFLKSIKTEIIPFVEREYRADPSYRVLMGASLGGLFTLYSMYAEPGLFHAYVAATPSLYVGNDWMFGFEEEFAKSDRKLSGRLFVSAGGNESPRIVSTILRFNQRIASRKNYGLTYQFRMVEDERHAGMQFESYQRGLRFAFAPLAPESGPLADR